MLNFSARWQSGGSRDLTIPRLHSNSAFLRCWHDYEHAHCLISAQKMEREKGLSHFWQLVHVVAKAISDREVLFEVAVGVLDAIDQLLPDVLAAVHLRRGKAPAKCLRRFAKLTFYSDISEFPPSPWPSPP
jgi:hypothetical protein